MKPPPLQGPFIEAPAYAEGLRLFREQHWFEAHEVLEGLWRSMPHGQERLFIQGLIQLSVSLEHWRRGNPRGARGQWEKGRSKLTAMPASFGGLNIPQLLQDFERYWSLQDLDNAVQLQAKQEPFHQYPLSPPSPHQGA